MRGVYYKPEYNYLIGEAIAPAPDEVARALARNYGWTIVPCGDTALNLPGHSTQVPAQWFYVSDGTYKEYSFDNTVFLCLLLWYNAYTNPSKCQVMMMRMGDNMAMDMDSGDLHIISSWGRDDDDNDFFSNNRSLWDDEEDS